MCKWIILKFSVPGFEQVLRRLLAVKQAISINYNLKQSAQNFELLCLIQRIGSVIFPITTI